MIITQNSNFMRIFQLPPTLPTDFCFSGGIPCEFVMVDWFNPYSTTEVKPNSYVEVTPELEKKLVESLRKFIKGKVYYKPNRKYIAISDFGLAFTIQEGI